MTSLISVPPPRAVARLRGRLSLRAYGLPARPKPTPHRPPDPSLSFESQGPVRAARSVRAVRPCVATTSCARPGRRPWPVGRRHRSACPGPVLLAPPRPALAHPTRPGASCPPALAWGRPGASRKEHHLPRQHHWHQRLTGPKGDDVLMLMWPTLDGLLRNGFWGLVSAGAVAGLGLGWWPGLRRWRQGARLARVWVVRWPVVMALVRLCTAAVKVHSAAALGRPRMVSWRKRMLCLMWPWGVSAMWPRWR